MDEKTASVLAKRLAAYSATAGITLALAPVAGAQRAPSDAEAERGGPDSQVVYLDIDPDAVLRVQGQGIGDVYSFDFDDDGNADLLFYACEDAYGCYLRGYPDVMGFRPPPGGANALNGVLGYAPGRASRLSSGEVIGSQGAGQAFYRTAVAAQASAYSAGFGEFLGQTGHVGFRFIAGDGQVHFGWIRLAVNGDATQARLFEYGYEATPETPILAGAFSNAYLTGSVNQTAFPPEGGTFRYTFTVENITNSPLPLDLWLDARRGGDPVRTALLGSGTLAPRARVTRTVSVPVSASAPAGAYDVRFKVGDFASRQFLTFERFAVTKAPPARLAASSGEAEPFAVVPFAGDLFAEADAAVTGTHALSAPSPNPAAGRAGVTLQVAEAQHVTVAAFDALGRKVAILHEGPVAAGTEHRLAFDGSRLPAGVYVVRAVGEAFSDTRVLTLTR